jgi:cysteine desulfurase/selenocysteine lyase
VLPWKFAAGTPNILGTIMAAEAMRLLVDLGLHPASYEYFRSERSIPYVAVTQAMGRISDYTRLLAERALEAIGTVPGVTIYGPQTAQRRVSLVAFNVAGRHPEQISESLAAAGVESRAGCHCATLAHRYIGLEPPASCRLSFYLYNTVEEVEFAADALARTVVPAPI